jgi:hypothetical protein
MGQMRESHCTVNSLNKCGQPAAVTVLTELYYISFSRRAQRKSNTSTNLCIATKTNANTPFHFNAMHNSVHCPVTTSGDQLKKYGRRGM